MLTIEKLIEQAAQDGIREGIKAKLVGYGSPLEKLCSDAISAYSTALSAMLKNSLCSCVNSDEFQEEIRVAVRHKLARTLIEKFGGELEKQVNLLKSDPATRARITLAIEEIVGSR